MVNFCFRLNLLIIATIWFASINLFGQNVEIAPQKSSIEVTADSLFSKNLYAEALPEYQKLIEQFPQDPNFHYKIGVCYLMVTKKLEKSIEHLKFASTRQVTNLVYYYLAEAFFHSYQFDDALSYYRRFIINGGDPEVPTPVIERRVGQCENGNFMIRFIYQPKVIERKMVHKNDFYRYINTKSSNGTFILKPNDLKTSTDLKQGDNSIIFYPTNPQQGDKIFYSSYGSTTSYGKDIFMIEFQADGFWSKPRNLGDVVNSSFDEDFPYLASDGVSLYFASNGHYSMGGYDIYRSVYNPSTKQWSTPENLGFPFSSPFDDFLLVPDEKYELATFVTNRNTSKDSLEIILVEIDDNPIRRPFDRIESIWNIAKLDPRVIAKKEMAQTASSKTSQPKSASFNAVENDPEYSRALAQGFTQQMRADSLRVRLEALRERFDFINTADERRALERQVVTVENALLEAQRSADDFFVRASQIEQEYITGKRKPIDKPTTTFASDNPKFLYQAQFAPTVFQTDELNRLAQWERLTPQIETQRRELIELKNKIELIESNEPDSYNENPHYQKHKADWSTKIRSFSNLLNEQTGGKKALYRECVSVAMVKRGASNDIDIRSEIDRANQHFRAATAIRNNATEEEMVQSTYDALLLDELGVLRLEFVFAKLWGMRLFEQEVLSKIYRLEQNIFGSKLPVTPQKIIVEKTVSEDQELDKKDISITRVDENKVKPDAILFHSEEEIEFQVVEKSPYSSTNPIPVDTPFPSGVIYRIQVAAFSNPVAIDYFKGMVPINGERVSGGKVTKYYIGNFRLLNDAEKALPIVRSKGFKDAFIVAWHNGRSIALSRAKSLESTEDLSSNGKSPRISIEQDGRLYMIQFGHYKGRLPDGIAQTVRALAPGKDIIRKPDDQGGFIYSVGSYTDAVEATRVKDNLIGSGIKNAFVVVVELDDN